MIVLWGLNRLIELGCIYDDRISVNGQQRIYRSLRETYSVDSLIWVGLKGKLVIEILLKIFMNIISIYMYFFYKIVYGPTQMRIMILHESRI